MAVRKTPALAREPAFSAVQEDVFRELVLRGGATTAELAERTGHPVQSIRNALQRLARRKLVISDRTRRRKWQVWSATKKASVDAIRSGRFATRGPLASLDPGHDDVKVLAAGAEAARAKPFDPARGSLWKANRVFLQRGTIRTIYEDHSGKDGNDASTE